MTNKIDLKIIGYRVKTEGTTPVAPTPEPIKAVLHEKTQRPDQLIGATYKVKDPSTDHAMYITINDIVINPGTEAETRHPYEVFINTKDTAHFQWVFALTRVISAVFRKGGEVDFLVEELKSVFDPKGGYFKKGGRYIPSLVAEIGYALEAHLLYSNSGSQKEEMSEAQQEFLDKKRQEFEEVHGKTEGEEYPAKAVLCQRCSTKAVVLLDGCMTCLSCGDSKCG